MQRVVSGILRVRHHWTFSSSLVLFSPCDFKLFANVCWNAADLGGIARLVWYFHGDHAVQWIQLFGPKHGPGAVEPGPHVKPRFADLEVQRSFFEITY